MWTFASFVHLCFWGLLSMASTVAGFSFQDALRLHLHGDDFSTHSQPHPLPVLKTRTKRASSSVPKHTMELMLQGESVLFELSNRSELAVGHRECLFQGRSIAPNNSFSVAVTGCNHDTHAFVLTDDNHFFSVRPDKFFSNDSNSDPKRHRRSSHIVQKRFVDWHSHSKCGYEVSDDPFPEDRINMAGFAAVHRFEELTIELGLFIDDAMWSFFEKLYGSLAESELRRFVLAAINNIDLLFDHSSIEPKVRLRIAHLEVLKNAPMELARAVHDSGEVSRLLNGFCDFQAALNPVNDKDPKHWDHALLLTGYDLYRGKDRAIAGFAPVKGMCVDLKSCTVNEGLDFGAVFVIAHEMGHSLGMGHDGENNGCQSRCCIMSSSIGAGKTQWSDCSVNELQFFVANFGSTNRSVNCLRDGLDLETSRLPIKKRLPGQVYTLHEQCALFHGFCWHFELKDGQKMRDVCEMVWCSNGEGIVRSTHPALEGSFCGSGRICKEGRCTEAETSLEAVAGGWSAWRDTGPCNGDCSDCRIRGQMRVRRSVRLCNHPYPNNDGTPCEGSAERGLRCGNALCNDAPPVEEFVNGKCLNFSIDPNLFELGLSGTGTQFVQAPCKVWCHVADNHSIRTMSDLPDGTPCGDGRFCLKGDCLTLSCDDKALVADPSHCPEHTNVGPDLVERIEHTPSPSASENDKTLSAPASDTLLPTESPQGRWTDWGTWSRCVAAGCGFNGLKQRQRRCEHANDSFDAPGNVHCAGPRRQRTSCVRQC